MRGSGAQGTVYLLHFVVEFLANRAVIGPNGRICCYSAGFQRTKEMGQEERGCVGSAAPKWCVGQHLARASAYFADEHEEVIVVKRALLEHLDMDPPATLGVLCDQIVHPQEPMEEEEQQTRDNLRSLVISFLVGEAKRGIARHANRLGSEAEAALVDELLAVRYLLICLLMFLLTDKNRPFRG